MTLDDQRWITLRGDPITGRSPTQLIVMNDAEMTREQFAGVQKAVRSFFEAVAVTPHPNGYHLHRRELSDGTRIRMESNLGVRKVMVWPTNSTSKREPRPPLRGFVIIPLGLAGHDMAGLDKSTLTRLKSGVWGPWVRPYAPRNEKEYLPYLVGRVRSRPPGGVDVVSDDLFHDVYSVANGVHKNAVPFAGMHGLNIAGGVPVVFQNKAIVFVTSDAVAYIGGEPLAVQTPYQFTPAPHFDPYAAAFRFDAGPELVRSGLPAETSCKVRYLAYNKWEVGLVEVWRGTVPLTDSGTHIGTPIEALSYIPAPAPMQDMNSFVTTSGSPRSTPITTPNEVPSVGWLYHGGFEGYMLSGGWQAGSMTAHEVRVYDHAFSDAQTLQINEADSISIDRAVTVDSEQHRYIGSYKGSWPVEGIGFGGWFYTNGGPPAYVAQFTGYYDGHVSTVGDTYGIYATYLETVGELTHLDTSYCTVTLADLPKKLYDVSVTRSHHEISGWAQEFDTRYMYYGEYIEFTAAPTPTTVMMIPGTGGYLPFTTDAKAEHQITHAVVAEAVDYLYCDHANEVYIWIEAQVSSDATDERDETGTSSVVIKAVVRFNGGSTETVLYQQSYSTPRTFALMRPPGIDFDAIAYDGTVIPFQYHPIPQPAPIFAPLWREQGMCPYVVYTTKEEHTASPSPVTPRFATHLRLQLVRTDRGFLADPPILADVVQFSPYMCEQLLTNYGAETGLIFAAFEATPTVIKFTSPDPALFSNVGAPIDDANQFAKFYRT